MVRVPLPVAIQRLLAPVSPFQEMPNPIPLDPNTSTPVQEIPSVEYASVFVPSPTATQRLSAPDSPLHATLYPAYENVVFPNAVQVVPLSEYIIVLVFVLSNPTATYRPVSESRATPKQLVINVDT
jgi:hypothetical protein